MERVFEPSIDQQQIAAEKKTKKVPNRFANLGNTFFKGLENYDEITQRTK